MSRRGRRPGARAAGTKKKACAVCGKPVYKNEELRAIGRLYHDSCFQCVNCGKSLNLQTYKEHNRLPHCATCFGRSGGASQGFGAGRVGNYEKHYAQKKGTPRPPPKPSARPPPKPKRKTPARRAKAPGATPAVRAAARRSLDRLSWGARQRLQMMQKGKKKVQQQRARPAAARPAASNRTRRAPQPKRRPKPKPAPKRSCPPKQITLPTAHPPRRAPKRAPAAARSNTEAETEQQEKKGFFSGLFRGRAASDEAPPPAPPRRTVASPKKPTKKPPAPKKKPPPRRKKKAPPPKKAPAANATKSGIARLSLARRTKGAAAGVKAFFSGLATPRSDEKKAGTLWEVTFEAGVAYRSKCGDYEARVLRPKGPLKGEVVSAAEYRNKWIRVKTGGRSYWLPTTVPGIGAVLKRK